MVESNPAATGAGTPRTKASNDSLDPEIATCQPSAHRCSAVTALPARRDSLGRLAKSASTNCCTPFRKLVNSDGGVALELALRFLRLARTRLPCSRSMVTKRDKTA